jgi:drug/metabolite transporter (DMT)-like permease
MDTHDSFCITPNNKEEYYYELNNNNNNNNNLDNNNNNNININPLLSRKFSIASNSSNYSTRVKNEYIGYLFGTIGIFFQAFGTFYIKIMQKIYPNDFHTIQFLLIRALMLLTLAFFHSYKTNHKIEKFLEINQKFWFFIRTNVNFLAVSTFTMSLWYLRTSTAQIISTLTPLVVLVLSYFVLKENLHLRYLIGTFMCLTGAIIIISNERKTNNNNNKNLNNNLNNNLNENLNNNNNNNFISIKTLIGVGFGIVNCIAMALVNVSNKILVKNKIAIDTQMFYVGIATFSYSFICLVFDFKFCMKFWLNFMYYTHGLTFYGFNLFFNEALKRAPLAKLIIIQYLNVVFIFVLAFLFLHEKIFFSDILGAAIMISYMVYNAMNPLKTK